MKYLIPIIALLAAVQSAHAQSDAELVATYSEPEAASAEEQAPQAAYQQMAALGGADASGGNFVGDELFDDYENKGVTKLSAAEIASAIKPVTDRLDKLLPSFSKYLLEGASKTNWLLDPKPLRQDGACLNQTSLSVKAEIRACQSKLAVRIDQKFTEDKPQVMPGLYVHELLVYHALRSGGKISEEGLREASRAIRNPSISDAELKQALIKSGFGSYTTASEIAVARKAEADSLARAEKLCEDWHRLPGSIITCEPKSVRDMQKNYSAWAKSYQDAVSAIKAIRASRKN